LLMEGTNRVEQKFHKINNRIAEMWQSNELAECEIAQPGLGLGDFLFGRRPTETIRQ